MSFLGLFDNKTSTPAPAPAATAPATAAPNTTPAADPFALPATQDPAKSPAPEFNKLWEPIAAPAADPNAPKAPTNEDKMKSTIEAARQIDFTKVIPADTMAKIGAGGPEAQVAFAEAINLVNQATFAQSSFAANQMMEQAIATAKQEFQKEIPAIIRQHNIRDMLQGEDARYQDPEIAPILKAIDQQITLKFPDATGAQINTLRSQYLDRFTGKIAPKQDVIPPKDPRNGDVEDWDALMTRTTYS